MKNILIIIAFSLIPFLAMSQVPQGINYQGSLRDNAGFTIAGKQIALRLSIVKDSANGISEYRERHSVTTSNLGLFDVVIGTGTVLSGNFLLIDWGASKKFLRIEIDTANGNSFVFMGATQFLSVPYALRSGKATEAEKLSNDSNGGLVPKGGTVILNTSNSPPGYRFISELQIPYSLQVENSDSNLSNTIDMVIYGDSILISKGAICSYYDIKLKKYFSLGSPRRTDWKNTMTLINDKFYYLKLNDTIFEYYPPTNTWSVRGFLGNIIPAGGYSYTGKGDNSIAIFGNSIYLSANFNGPSDRLSKVIQFNYLTNQVFDRGVVNSCNNSVCGGINSKLFCFQNKLFLLFNNGPYAYIYQYNTTNNGFSYLLTDDAYIVNIISNFDTAGVYFFTDNGYGRFFNGFVMTGSFPLWGNILYTDGPYAVYWTNNPNFLGYLLDVRTSKRPTFLGTLDNNMTSLPTPRVVRNGVIYSIGISTGHLTRFILPKTLYLHQKN